jgi:putative oxidoreductase
METPANSPDAATGIFQRAYRLLVRAAGGLRSPVLLALRVCWGWQFFLTGLGKLKHHQNVAGFFHDLHIPAPGLNAWLAGGTECFGGLLLLIGLGSRLVSIPLIFVLIIAYATAEYPSVKAIFTEGNLDKFTAATPFLFLVACVMVLAFGPGKLSLDWLLEKTVFGKNNTPQP